MKRTLTTYHCDVCLAELEPDQTVDCDGHNWGLCGDCMDAGWDMRKIRSESGFIVHFLRDGQRVDPDSDW